VVFEEAGAEPRTKVIAIPDGLAMLGPGGVELQAGEMPERVVLGSSRKEQDPVRECSRRDSFKNAFRICTTSTHGNCHSKGHKLNRCDSLFFWFVGRKRGSRRTIDSQLRPSLGVPPARSLWAPELPRRLAPSFMLQERLFEGFNDALRLGDKHNREAIHVADLKMHARIERTED